MNVIEQFIGQTEIIVGAIIFIERQANIGSTSIVKHFEPWKFFYKKNFPIQP